MHPETPRLDPAGLEQMRENFLARMDDFGDFGDVPSRYHAEERAYKDEAASLVRTHLSNDFFARRGGAFNPEHDEQVVAATLRVLTTRLQSIGQPQNIMSWRYIDFLRQMDAEERSLFSREFGFLLWGGGDAASRIGRSCMGSGRSGRGSWEGTRTRSAACFPRIS